MAIHGRMSRPSPTNRLSARNTDNAERDGRLDQMRRRIEHIQHRQRQRDAVRERKRRDHDKQLPERSAEQQQTDQKQHMVGTDKDVVYPLAARTF